MYFPEGLEDSPFVCVFIRLTNGVLIFLDHCAFVKKNIVVVSMAMIVIKPNTRKATIRRILIIVDKMGGIL